MIVRLKFLVKDTNSIPQLGIPNILQTVKCLLISIKGFVDIITEEVTVANGGPRWPILWINLCHLQVVLDGRDVIAFGPIVFSHS